MHLCCPSGLEQRLAQRKHPVKWCSYPRSHSPSSPDSKKRALLVNGLEMGGAEPVGEGNGHALQPGEGRKAGGPVGKSLADAQPATFQGHRKGRHPPGEGSRVESYTQNMEIEKEQQGPVSVVVLCQA